jgi:uncharacterized protein (TIGR04255 family)
MALKDYPHVHYRKNPLVEVICQVRFPRILSIDGEVPSAFQNEINSQYPNLQTANEFQQQLSVDMTDDNPIPRFAQEKRLNYAFVSADAQWKVNLASTFFSLSTRQYCLWEKFYEKLTSLIEVFHKVYPLAPSEYERVGLRYINAISRSKLGLTDCDWKDLIHPSAIGLLSNSDIKKDITSFNSSTEFKVDNESFARISTGLGFTNSANTQVPMSGQELSLIIDNDIFTFKVNRDMLCSRLEYIHKISTNIIQSVITDKLRQAMEPEKI